MAVQYILIEDVNYLGDTLKKGKLIDPNVYDLNALILAGAQLYPFDAEAITYGQAISDMRSKGHNPGIDPGTPNLASITTTAAATALSQLDWYIDPVDGKDSNTGKTANKALKTFAELERRWGHYNTLDTGDPTYPAVTVHVLGDTNPNDLMNFLVTFGKNTVLLIVEGTPKSVKTGSITAMTAQDPANNQGWEITDTALPGSGFGPYVGKRIRLTSGANAGAYSYVVKDLGSKTARCCEWLKTDDLFPDVTSGPSVSDTYVIEDLPIVYPGTLSYRTGGDAVGLPEGYWGKDPVFKNLTFTHNPAAVPHIFSVDTVGAGQFQMQSIFAGCITKDIQLIACDSGIVNMLHCCLQDNGSNNDAWQSGDAGSLAVYAGANIGAVIAADQRGHVDIALNTYFQGPLQRTLTTIQDSTMNCGSVAFFDVTPTFGGGLVNAAVNSVITGLSQYTGQSIYVWGSGNDFPALFVGESGKTGTIGAVGTDNIEDAFPVETGSFAIFSVGAGGLIGEIANPGSGDVTVHSWNQATGAYTAPRNITLATINAAVGSGGFVSYESGPFGPISNIKRRVFFEPTDDASITASTISFV